MDSHHLIDVSRLRIIEEHRHRASGASRAAYERVKKLDERSTSLESQLRDVRRTLRDGSWSAVVTEGMAPSLRSSSVTKEAFREKEARLIREIAEVARKSEEARVIQEQEQARFSEAGDLFEACKKFLTEGLAND